MKKIVLLVIIFTFTQGVIHNLGHPITPAFVRGLGISDYMFGVFFASMSLGLMIGGPIWGILSDSGKKRIYIVVGLLMYSLGQLFFGYATNPLLMIFFRFLSGFGVVASITLMTSMLIENSTPQNRAKHLAYSAAAFTVGASLGYFIGGVISTEPFFINLLGTSDLRIIFLIQALANTLYVGVVMVMLKNYDADIITEDKPSFIQGLKDITKLKPSLLLFFLSLTFMTMGSINISKYIDVHFDTLGFNPQQLGTFVMATGFVALFATIFIVPIFAKFPKQLATIAVTQIISAIIIFYVFRSYNFLVTMYTVFMIYVIFRTIYLPLEQNFIAKYAQKGRYGSIMGLRISFFSIGMIIGPLAGGFIYDYKPLWLFDFSASAFLVGVLLLIGVRFLEIRESKKVK